MERIQRPLVVRDAGAFPIWKLGSSLDKTSAIFLAKKNIVTSFLTNHWSSNKEGTSLNVVINQKTSTSLRLEWEFTAGLCRH